MGGDIFGKPSGVDSVANNLYGLSSQLQNIYYQNMDKYNTRAENAWDNYYQATKNYQTLQDLATNQYSNQVGLQAPVTEAVYKQLADYAAGNFDPTETWQWDAGKLAADKAYGSAKENILGNIASGGLLNESLANADVSRAEILTNLASQISSDMYNRIYNAGTNQLTAPYLGGGPSTPGVNVYQGNELGTAGYLQGSLLQQLAAAQAGAAQNAAGFGEGLGNIIAQLISSFA